MKMNPATKKMPNCLLAVALTALCAVTTARAAAPNLGGQITLRPLTPQDIKDYKLTGAQGASGLSTVGKGQPAYLEVLVNYAFTNSDITNIVWNLTGPVGSAAALAESPLGADVPTYKMANRYNNAGAPVYKVAGRKLLLPDATGLYTVTATVQTKQVTQDTNLTQNVTASTYMVANTCELCHSGGLVAPDKFEEWSKTPHATFFTRAIDGLESDHYGKNCIVCHTVGYDANTNAVNGGFDDIAKSSGWAFPAVLTNGNWATSSPAIKNLANIQCENCHGAGSEHAFGELIAPSSPAAKAAIAVSFAAGNCAQCHDSKPNHVRSAEWNNSKHAVATRTPSGPTRPQCARCHTASGFAAYTETLGSTNAWTGTNVAFTTYEAITCASCHDPHNDENPHQLRAAESVTLADGDKLVTITDAGAGSLCMNCHQSRTGSYTNSLVEYPAGRPNYPGTPTASFGPHDNPASEMIQGVNGYTYGQVIPSSAHRSSVSNTCAGCHMQAVASTDPAFTKAGGHTFSMTYSNATGAVVDKVDVCVKCHGAMDSFDLVRKDYHGDGVIEGIQSEVKKLISKLSTLLPPSTYQSNAANYVADGLVKSPSVKTNWPAKFLQAAWNYQLVNNDLSFGIHNAAYAVGLLNASIADLTGDSNNDGLPDAWQIQYFGSANDPKAAPNATPAGDGVPNWLKYSLGLNPLVAGVVYPDGVVWVNNGTSGGDTNTVRIYTAAEVVFESEVGTSYQIQSTSSMSDGWQNVGQPIPGTGQAISYVTPTRSNVQQYYRVVH